MEKDLPGPGQGLHRPAKFRLVQLLGGLLQIELLPLQPGGGGEGPVLGQGTGHLGRGAGGLLHHHGFQLLEVGTAHMAGKAGDGGVGEFQPPCQLADGGKQKGVGVGVDVVEDLLLRPGQLPGRDGKTQFHRGSPIR